MQRDESALTRFRIDVETRDDRPKTWQRAKAAIVGFVDAATSSNSGVPTAGTSFEPFRRSRVVVLSIESDATVFAGRWHYEPDALEQDRSALEAQIQSLSADQFLAGIQQGER